MIEVINKSDKGFKYRPEDRYCGRPSTLGNPFTHLPLNTTNAVYQVGTREESILRHREWLKGVLRESLDFQAEVAKLRVATTNQIASALLDILTLETTNSRARLLCYCSPLECHCDTLKVLLENLRLLDIKTPIDLVLAVKREGLTF